VIIVVLIFEGFHEFMVQSTLYDPNALKLAANGGGEGRGQE
jgi:hypothetical protein